MAPSAPSKNQPTLINGIVLRAKKLGDLQSRQGEGGERLDRGTKSGDRRMTGKG